MNTAQRWRRIEELCHQALAREPGERAAFLDQACGGDSDLRREVESLLAQQSEARPFLETPTFTLAPGSRLGPYEITSRIGAGGMGEVYKARDVRLGRTVAIKVLPSEVAADPERRRRFEHEARAVSALNHPNICTLHDIGREVPAFVGSEAGTVGLHGGTTPIDYLVMEFVEGRTLGERLRKGSLPLEEALEYGAQIADALGKAHRQGIVHRDLKPANIMLTKSGIKLLDFGLAKLKRAPAAGVTGRLSAVATQEPKTTPGVILGTVPYMAPEQLEGKETDARADIFAFGCVLYEMLTGRRAFAGESEASIISAIMSSQPAPVSSLQRVTPPGLDRLVARCLVKEPDRRWDSACDAADELRWITESKGTSVETSSGRHGAAATVLVLLVVAVVAGIIGAAVTWSRTPSVPPSPVVRSWLSVAPAEELNSGGATPMPNAPGGSRTALCWTPDGQALVFVGRRGGRQQLFLRELRKDEAVPIEGTEGAQAPAVSPDGQWVAFWAAGALKKVPLRGGLATEIVRLDLPPGTVTWDERGTLYFTPVGGIRSVGPNGELVNLTPKQNAWQQMPFVLPGAETLLYIEGWRGFTWGGEKLVARNLKTGERKQLVLTAPSQEVRYVPTGHLVLVRKGELYAVAFDAKTLKIQGPEVPMLDGVGESYLAWSNLEATGAGQFAISSTGTLAWVRSPIVPLGDRAIVVLDRQGRMSQLPAPVLPYGSRVRLAPGGHQLVVNVNEFGRATDAGTECGVWIYDLERASMTALIREGEAMSPVWTPDGRRVVFAWNREGTPILAWQDSAGATPPEEFGACNPVGCLPSSWTPDGRHLAVISGDDQNRERIFIATVETGHATFQEWPRTPGTVQSSASFSPDGHWLVFSSNDSWRSEIYVQPYPGPGGKVPVSTDGGVVPAWHPDGRRIYFVNQRSTGKRRMMEVDFDPGPPLRIGIPKPLFDLADDLLVASSGPRSYDVAPDGRLFFLQERRSPPVPTITHIDLIQNWFEELKAKAPARR